MFEPAFKADLTLSIELVKRGMVQFPARSYCGDIFPVPIGLECKQESEYVLLYQNSFPPLRREIDAHKGKFGRVFVIGGSDCYPGAAILASHSALRVGSGLVALSVLQNVAYPLLWPEIIRVPVMGNERQYTRDSIKGLEDEVHKCSCLVIGPGVGTGRSVRCFVFELLELTNSLGVPTVIDADGINLIAEAILNNELSANLSQTVLTPHPGEASRLLNMTTSDVQMDRYSACRRIHESTGSVCVLKGAASIVYGYGKGYVCTCSNPYLATGGSGDVLSGIIAGLIAQGDYLLEAAARGVFIHAQAGEIASSAHSSPIIASDIIDSIPLAIGNNKQIVIAS